MTKPSLKVDFDPVNIGTVLFLCERDGNDFKQTTRTTSCKDYIHQIIKDGTGIDKKISSTKGIYYDTNGYSCWVNGKLPNNEVIVGFLTRHKINKLISLHDHNAATENLSILINSVDRAIGNKPTEILKVDIDKREMYPTLNGVPLVIYANVLIGSELVLYNPHLLSLYILLLRHVMSNNIKIHPEVDDDVEMVPEFLLRENTIYANMCGNDYGYISLICGTIGKIISNFRDIFDGIEREKLFDNNYTFHSNGGIVALCKGSTANTTVNERMKKLINGGG